MSATESPGRGRGDRDTNPHARAPEDDGASPVPRADPAWPRAYALVLGVLAVEVVLLWLLNAVYGGVAA